MQVGAYFYPHASNDFDGLAQRRLEVGEKLGRPLEPVVELDLVQNAKPLFPGHQPERHFRVGGQHTWDDSQPGPLYLQAVLAISHGLSYWIMDSYEGTRQNQPVSEMDGAIGMIRKLTTHGLWPGLTYAKMQTLESPRVVLPIPNMPDNIRGFGGGYQEPNRQYDLNEATAHFIVDESAKDWENPYYLRAGTHQEPYMSVLMPKFPATMPEKNRQEKLDRFMDCLRTYSAKEYGVALYLVGVLRHPDDTAIWTKVGVEAVTQYAKLFDPSPDAPHIQQYSDRIDPEIRHWNDQKAVAAQGGIPFIPSPAVGWDATYRGEKGVNFEDVRGFHPYSPVVIGNTPQNFARMLAASIDFTQATVPEKQRQLTIFAWNEYCEGAALIPESRTESFRGFEKPYLDAIEEVLLDKGLLSYDWYSRWQQTRPY